MASNLTDAEIDRLLAICDKANTKPLPDWVISHGPIKIEPDEFYIAARLRFPAALRELKKARSLLRSSLTCCEVLLESDGAPYVPGAPGIMRDIKALLDGAEEK